MSKKNEMENFKEGMIAGAAPFADKFHEHADNLKNLNKNFQHNINCIDDLLDDVINVTEEQDERLKHIENTEKEQLKELSKDEQNILVGILIYVTEKYLPNDDQVRFLENVKDLLLIKECKKLEFETLEKVENIRTQRIIFKIVNEIMFLKKETTEFENDFYEECDYFSINKRAKEAILTQIENSFQLLGKEKFINKYVNSVEVDENKKKKIYPKLEVNTSIKQYKDEILSFELDFEYDTDVYDKVFRKESECREAYMMMLWKPLSKRNAYIDLSSDKFIGIKIADYYGSTIVRELESVLDYINIHKVRMDITEFLELRDGCQEYIKEYTKEKIANIDYNFELHNINYFAERLTIEEDVTWIETLFGDFKEVTCYDEGSGYSCIDAVEEMTQELNQLINYIIIDIHYMVLDKYISRINNCVEQINNLLGN